MKRDSTPGTPVPYRAELIDVEYLLRKIHAGESVDLRGSESNLRPVIDSSIIVRALCRIATTDQSQRPRLRILGGSITGDLDLEGMRLELPMKFHECDFDGSIILDSGDFHSLDLSGSSLSQLQADDSRFTHNLIIQRAVLNTGYIRIRGAHIGGRLDVSSVRIVASGGTAIDADGALIGQELRAYKLRSDGQVRFRGARVHQWASFVGANIDLKTESDHAIYLAGLQVEQDVNFGSMFCRGGELSLIDARIGGSVSFQSAHLCNSGQTALYAGRLKVGEGLFCRKLIAHGRIDLTNAVVQGQFVLDKANVGNVMASGIHVSNGILCKDGFESNGEFCLLRARIDGNISFEGVEFSRPTGRAVHLEGARVSALIFHPKSRPSGYIDLTGTHVERLDDDIERWPDKVLLRGFVYDDWANDGYTVRQRLDWLRLHNAGATYSPAIYDQLAAVYRSTGNLDAARKVGLAKQRRRRRELNLPGKIWSLMLDLTVGFGYRTWLAGVWLAALVIAGGAAFSLFRDSFVPKTDEESFIYRVAYALDTILPVVDLKQADSWSVSGMASVLTWFLTIAGWVLGTAVIAGVTNALKRD